MLNTSTRLFFAFLKYAALVPLAPSNQTIGSGSPRLRPTKQLAPVPTGSDQPNNWLWFPLAPTNQTIGSGSPRLQPTKQLAPVTTGSDQPNNWLRFPPAPTNQTIGSCSPRLRPTKQLAPDLKSPKKLALAPASGPRYWFLSPPKG